MNKFEQVFSDGHQMSLAGRQGPGRVGGPISGWWGRDQGGPMYSEDQCIMDNVHMMTLPSPHGQADRHTRLKT